MDLWGFPKSCGFEFLWSMTRPGQKQDSTLVVASHNRRAKLSFQAENALVFEVAEQFARVCVCVKIKAFLQTHLQSTDRCLGGCISEKSASLLSVEKHLFVRKANGVIYKSEVRLVWSSLKFLNLANAHTPFFFFSFFIRWLQCILPYMDWGLHVLFFYVACKLWVYVFGEYPPPPHREPCVAALLVCFLHILNDVCRMWCVCILCDCTYFWIYPS